MKKATRKKRSAIWKISREEFIVLLKRSETFTQVLSSFGLRNVGSNYTTLVSRLKHENLDWTKFKANYQQTKRFCIRSLEEILVENSDYGNTSNLKHRLIKAGLLNELCEICGLIEWCGNKLSLVLDHKNGVRSDNRLENLRLLCPNCNSQTETFAGRNKKYSRVV